MPSDNETVRFELTRLDEWPRHQTGATFNTIANESPHWSDGYYFTLGDDAGALMFIMGFRLYANNDVLDAFALVSHEGRQHNMRWSRRLRPAIDELRCGPLWVDIVEGLRTLRIGADPNPYGITFEMTWEGIHPPYLEDYLVIYRSGRLVSERSNYDQAARVSGWLTLGEQHFEIDPEHWVGVRDHSWGVGSTGGGKAPNAAPALNRDSPIGQRQWSVFSTNRGRTIFWQFHRNAAGELTKFESQVVAPYDDPTPPWAYETLDDSPTWVRDADGTVLRRLDRSEVTLRRPDGGTDRWLVETISPPCYCLGGGYWNGFDDHKGRGTYRGDLHHEGEVWDIAHPTRIVDPKGVAQPRNEWAETWGRFTNLDDPTEVGYGHLECVVLGPYPGVTDERPPGAR